MKHEIEGTEPDPGDRGWYLNARTSDAAYMVGASADAEEPQLVFEWTVQLHERRSFTDKLLGRNKEAPDDRLLAGIERVIWGSAGATDIVVDRDARQSEGAGVNDGIMALFLRR